MTEKNTGVTQVPDDLFMVEYTAILPGGQREVKFLTFDYSHAMELALDAVQGRAATEDVKVATVYQVPRKIGEHLRQVAELVRPRKTE